MDVDQRQIDELAKQVAKGGGELPAKRLQAISLHRIAAAFERAVALTDEFWTMIQEVRKRREEEDHDDAAN